MYMYIDIYALTHALEHMSRCSLSQSMSTIKLVRGESRHTGCSNSTEVR